MSLFNSAQCLHYPYSRSLKLAFWLQIRFLLLIYPTFYFKNTQNGKILIFSPRTKLVSCCFDSYCVKHGWVFPGDDWLFRPFAWCPFLWVYIHLGGQLLVVDWCSHLGSALITLRVSGHRLPSLLLHGPISLACFQAASGSAAGIRRNKRTATDWSVLSLEQDVQILPVDLW